LSGRRLTVRAIALIGAASAAIHQLRYAIGYGDAASHALAVHDHGYLQVAFPCLLAVALIAIAATLRRLARSGASDRLQTPLLALWLACAFALASIFAIQETLEGAGAFAGGGWIGLALAVPAGLLVALALHGADAAELRLPGVAMRFDLAGARRPGITECAVCTRLADLHFGARAPPHSCVA
jgi:hypothetical protein